MHTTVSVALQERTKLKQAQIRVHLVLSVGFNQTETALLANCALLGMNLQIARSTLRLAHRASHAAKDG